ncbi:MAG: chemotaxis response regulator protein-glutamate methylesterase [Phycisphaeraceae bacterium]|nr:chemotaxis response regulator protein-glutamate methylesterase [Phycisphaeraceae bacterium]
MSMPPPPTIAGSSTAGAGAPRQIGVLVVDDSPFFRRALSKLIDSEPGMRVVGTARDGKDGLEKVKALRPDVVTLDVEMPGVDGMTCLRAIKRECNPPPAVLMCSSLTSAGSHAALQALRFGAAEVIAKDQSTISDKVEAMRDELIAKIRAIAPSGSFPLEAAATPVRAPSGLPRVALPEGQVWRIKPEHRFDHDEFGLIVIGSSTGGPPVLEVILSALPADLSCPVVVAQHMPVLFTRSLAQRLDEMCNMTVVHAEVGMPLHPGTIYMCQGGVHTHLVRGAGGKVTISTSEEPKSELYRPSVNVLFSTAAKVVSGKVLAVVLTGMGEDGASGAREIKARGGTILTQDAASCVVYGMPKAVVAAGVCDGVLTPEQIAVMLGSLAEVRPASDAAA